MGKSSAPKPPDYSALAVQQAELDRQAAGEQTLVNRPNQDTPWGSTDWTKNPDGTWNQKVTLAPEEQQALDQQRQFDLQQQGIATGLLDKAGQSLSNPLSFDGLPATRDIDMSQLPELADSGFGAVEQVRDAMMGRMGPARQRARESEIQRLKNQGLPENSEAFQRAMTRLDQGDTDAEMQSLLGATQAYGDIFDRSVAGRDQGMREQDASARLAGLLRQQGISEQQTLRQSPLDDFMKLTQGINPSMPQMPSFMGGTGYQAADMAGAADKQFQAKMDAYNAKQAQRGGLTSGLFGLAGSALGGGWF
jgi:hypothetical protein